MYIRCLLYTSAQDDTAKQMSDIEDIISQKPDYLIVSPRESEGLTPVLKSAMDAGIPVILVDRGINGEAGVDYTTLNSADLIWEGQTCAQYMKEQFGDERCNVVELTGTPGATSTFSYTHLEVYKRQHQHNVRYLYAYD